MMDFADLKHRGMRGGGVSRSASSDSNMMILPMAGDTNNTVNMSSSAMKRPGVQRSFSLNTRSRSYSSNENASSSLYKAVAGILFLAVVAMGYLMSDSTKKINRLKHDISHEAATLSKLHEKVATYEHENLKLSRELQLAEQQARNLEKGGDGELQKLDAMIKQLVQQKHATHDLVQQYSMKQLMQRFGPGPHRVEIVLDFDPNSNVAHDAGGDRILIELAPEADMPHSVYFFLTQVDLGLYNGASFHRNAHHVIQGGPVPNFATPHDAHLAQKFRQSGFNSVLFQEYSPNFPHQQYTLGYAGRPGGPDFYISVQDNTKNHGPGGQSAYNDPGEADPCFARVIEGVDAIERMQRSAVKPGDYHRMEHFVGIRYMKLVSGEEYHHHRHDEEHEGSGEHGGLEEAIHVEE